MGNIIWLASYPKSGNTWFRLFLANLFNKSGKEIDLDNIHVSPIASGRYALDEQIGIESDDLTADEIDSLLPELYRHISDTAVEPRFMKVHNAYTTLPDGRPLFPPEATKCTIYIIRNPLDLVASNANHNSSSIERAAERLTDTSCCLANSNRTFNEQFRQRLLAWDEHVQSWTGAANMNVHVIRYEDMKERTLETFAGTMRYAGFHFGDEEIQRALDACEFSKTREKEEKCGFKERPVHTKRFFRKGMVGSYVEELNEEQIARIKTRFAETMKQFGYL